MNNLSLLKLHVESVEPDIIYNEKVYSWKLQVRFPECKTNIVVKDRMPMPEVEKIRSRVINLLSIISKIEIKKEKFTGAIKCQYIGFVSFMDLFPTLQALHDELHLQNDSENEVYELGVVAGELVRNWSKPFDFWIFDEYPMIQTADGLMILSSGLMETLSLKEKEYYYIDIQEIYATSYKIVG